MPYSAGEPVSRRRTLIAGAPIINPPDNPGNPDNPGDVTGFTLTTFVRGMDPGDTLGVCAGDTEWGPSYDCDEARRVSSRNNTHQYVREVRPDYIPPHTSLEGDWCFSTNPWTEPNQVYYSISNPGVEGRSILWYVEGRQADADRNHQLCGNWTNGVVGPPTLPHKDVDEYGNNPGEWIEFDLELCSPESRGDQILVFVGMLDWGASYHPRAFHVHREGANYCYEGRIAANDALPGTWFTQLWESNMQGEKLPFIPTTEDGNVLTINGNQVDCVVEGQNGPPDGEEHAWIREGDRPGHAVVNIERGGNLSNPPSSFAGSGHGEGRNYQVECGRRD